MNGGVKRGNCLWPTEGWRQEKHDQEEGDVTGGQGTRMNRSSCSEKGFKGNIRKNSYGKKSVKFYTSS